MARRLQLLGITLALAVVLQLVLALSSCGGVHPAALPRVEAPGQA